MKFTISNALCEGESGIFMSWSALVHILGLSRKVGAFRRPITIIFETLKESMPTCFVLMPIFHFYLKLESSSTYFWEEKVVMIVCNLKNDKICKKWMEE